MSLNFGRPGLDQAKMETAQRSRNASAERQGTNKNTKGDVDSQRRQKLLTKFKPGDEVTNGRHRAKISSIDTRRGTLVVSMHRTGREQRWAPDFVTKV